MSVDFNNLIKITTSPCMIILISFDFNWKSIAYKFVSEISSYSESKRVGILQVE